MLFSNTRLGVVVFGGLARQSGPAMSLFAELLSTATIMGGRKVPIDRVGHGSTRGYPEVDPDPDPVIPYPTDPRASNPYGSPAGAELPAVPQTRRVYPH
jgi:hypothetical protein